MKTKIFALIAILAIVFASCGNKTNAQSGLTQAQIDSVSYAIGVSMGNSFKQSNLDAINLKEFAKAVNDILAGKTGDELKIKEDQIGQIIQTFMMKAAEAKSKKNTDEGLAFLETNKKKDGVVTLPSGLQYKILTAGSEIKPAIDSIGNTDTVVVKYTGKLIDGKEFDSSAKHGQDAEFPLGSVIKGFQEGIALIGEGGKIELYIPSALGYGEQQAGPEIGPNSTLIFEIELMKVKKFVIKPVVPVKK